MNHPRLYAVAMLTGIGTSSLQVSAQEEAAIPFGVSRIVDDAVAEVRKSRRLFDDDCKKVLSKTKKALEEELDRLFKAGKSKLDQAVLTREVIRSLEATVLRRAEIPAPTFQDRPAHMENWIVGKWSGENTPHIFEFGEAGQFEGKGKTANAKHWQGVWKSLRDGFIDVDVANSGRWEIRRCGPNEMAVVVYGPENKQSGDGFVLFRQQNQ